MGFLLKKKGAEILDGSKIAFGVFRVLTDEAGHPCDLEYAHVNDALAGFENMSKGKLTGMKFSKLHEKAAVNWAEMLYPAAYEDKHVERKNYIESLHLLAQISAFPIEKGLCGAFLKNFTSEVDGIIKSITGKDVSVFYYDLDRDVLIPDSAMINRFGCKIKYEGLINSFALEMVDEAYVDVLRTEMTSFPQENRLLETNLKLKSGKIVHFALSADENYKEERLALGYIEDVTNISALAREAELDSLTGLFHEAAARERIDSAISECVENDRTDALLMIDLDGFGVVNETLGYDKGDELLIKCAESIKNNFKGKDILARPGGDEYIVYVSDLSDKRAALMICRTLNKILNYSEKVKDDETIHVTASIGVAYTSDNGNSYDELVRNAGAALKEAKANGKNGYSLA